LKRNFETGLHTSLNNDDASWQKYQMEKVVEDFKGWLDENKEKIE
jgi:hypothetical protein